jgi:hypothetical protein
MVLNLKLKEESDLLFDGESEVLEAVAMLARSLRNNRTHVEVVAGKQHFHPP